EAAVGLYFLGAQGQNSAKQRFGLWRALLERADFRHEVKRPHLLGLLRQDAPELLFRIIEPVLSNKPGNRAARGGLPPERQRRSDDKNEKRRTEQVPGASAACQGQSAALAPVSRVPTNCPHLALATPR